MDFKMNGFGLIFVFFIALAPEALAFESAPGPSCSHYHSAILKKEVNFCLDRTTPEIPMTSGEPVAYFMHGTNGNAETWVKNNYANALHELRNSGQALPPMTFISFDTSKYSFFTDHPGKPKEAYETWFINEFIPYIENTYPVCREKKCRAMIGESMGGFGALKTTLRYPDLFSSVAVNSPALPPFSVRAPLRDWVWFFCHHHIGPFVGWMLIEIVRNIIRTEAVWEVQDPIHLVQNTDSNQIPPLYFDMGGKDKYGFNVGYWIFKDALDQKGAVYSTNYEPRAGHDMWKRHAGDAIRFILTHAAGLSEESNRNPVALSN
jgi:S-formylglutathione hydrolase FrmB